MIKAASKLTVIGNSIAGSEKIGLITNGVSCISNEQSNNQFRDNEVVNNIKYSYSLSHDFEKKNTLMHISTVVQLLLGQKKVVGMCEP